MLTSMYSSVRKRVFNNGEKSESYECNLGVRQGECLSPFLFAVYVNDMEEHLSDENAGVTIEDVKLVLLFYADDLVMFSDTPEGLQLQIDNLFTYCNRWKLTLNTDKSRIVVFKKGNRPLNFIWHFGEDVLKVTNEIPYLGIVFSANGSFNKAQANLAKQANKAVFMLRKKLLQFNNVKPEHYLDLFDKFISPVLSYGCEVWGFHPSPDIEKVHLSFCKRILSVKKRHKMILYMVNFLDIQCRL